jgi:hypothetical protein
MATKTSKGQEGYYARYKSGNVHAKNRKRKLERQLKLQPNNEQVKNALKDINYRRRTPGADGWSHSGIRMAKLFKEFCGSFDKAVLSSNIKQASEALQKLGSTAVAPKFDPKSLQIKQPFSIEARMRTR